MIHGGIDGYSRLPVFLEVHTDNRAETVLATFLRAVNKYGLPERVRSDKGVHRLNMCDQIEIAKSQIPMEAKLNNFGISGKSVVHCCRWRECQGC